jgi:serine/threonine protein kinase
VHSRILIHRDIKPENFLIGLGDKRNQIYLVDFGLAIRYLCHKYNLHIDYTDDNNLIGTPRYATINTHLGIQQSRRDDIESLGYILVYFLKGELPWQGIKANTIYEKYEEIKLKKIKTMNTICEGLPGKNIIMIIRGIRYFY